MLKFSESIRSSSLVKERQKYYATIFRMCLLGLIHWPHGCGFNSNIQYLSPHMIRHGYGVYAVKQAENIEEFKAYSQNMMHESMDITDRLYGRLSGEDVKAVVTGANKSISKDREAIFEEMLTWFETTKKAQK